MLKRSTSSHYSIRNEAGFRSGLEQKIAEELKSQGIQYRYEMDIINYVQPARAAKYHPDFILPNGIVIEAKGRFETKDRQKQLFVKVQHPDIDVRFVFSRAASRISKLSKTSYAMWCDRYGFPYVDLSIPPEWLDEPVNTASLDAIEAAKTKPNLEDF
jgi:hypothetical protein